MKKSIYFMALAAALLTTACVPSIHSFFSYKDVRFDRSVIGRWTDGDGDEEWEFSRKDDLAYSVKYVDRSGKTGFFTAYLFRIGGRDFLDLSPVRADADDSEIYVEKFLPTHTLMAINVEADRAQLSFLDPAWLKGFLKQNPEEIDHTIVDDEVVLTGTTPKLQAFIRRHIKTRGAFEDTELMFKKGDK